MESQPFAQPSSWLSIHLRKAELGGETLHLCPQGAAHLIGIRSASAKNQLNFPGLKLWRCVGEKLCCGWRGSMYSDY